MPFLGKKFFTGTSNVHNGNVEDAPYLIPHTKERFQSKSEYKKRKELYSQNIWTCRATGHSNLTHEEACESEKMVVDQLTTQFPKCFEKDVLEHVHHNTVSLETLVDKTWWKIQQQFLIGEKVNLKVKVEDKLIPGKVVAVDSSSVDVKPASSSSACNSPSSDKENSADEKDKDKSPKKWIPPKLLPYTYSIELEHSSQVIYSVPASELQRVERAPSKDMLRQFIRVSALRAGTCSTGPWVVNADLAKKYKLVSKFADFFLSPVKVSDTFLKEHSKKRKLSNGVSGSASKKLKLDKAGDKPKKVKSSVIDKDKTKSSASKKNKLANNSTSSPKKKLLSKKPGSPKKKLEKSSNSASGNGSEGSTAAVNLKRSNSSIDSSSDSDVPLYQLADQSTPKKKNKTKESITIDSSDEDIPLSKITPSTPKKAALKVENGDNSSKTGSPLSKKKSEKLLPKKSNVLQKNKDKKPGKAQPPKKGGMKQVTLYDLTKKGKLQSKISSNVTPQKKSPSKDTKSPPRPPPTPAIVRRLQNCKRETIYDKMKYSNLLKQAVSTLTPTQIKNVPEKLKEEIEQKKKFLDEKDKMAKMTSAERESYLKNKRECAKKLQKQKMLQKLRDLRKRYEDTDLELTPLPQAKLVPTPDGFPNEMFGDAAVVTEFINCYSGLLMPESEYPIYTDALMKALVGGSSGFTYVSRVLTVLLQTLVQDDTAKGDKELGTYLSDVAVSAYTSSELVRLCLLSEDDDSSEDTDVPEEYINLLKDSEFYQLDIKPKLCLLRGLCSRVLATYSVQDYMEEQQRKANALTRQKNTQMKQIAAQKKSEKSGTTPGDKSDSYDDKGLKLEDKTIDRQADKDSSGKDGAGAAADKDGEADDSNNWGSIVKRRRLLAAKSAAERERQEKERIANREKEYQEEKQREKVRKKQEQIADAINLAKMVLRQEPIGTDRHHDRYWVFTNVTPGLYVEKGWMGQEVSYSMGKLDKNRKDDDSSDSSSDDLDEHIAGSSLNTPLKYIYKAKRHVVETSVPRPGQNLWFTYRSQKDLDGLIKTLHQQGIRESMLRAEIKKRYDDISRAIIQAQRTNLELRDCDGDSEMAAGFKKELSDMELRLRNGGLGGVPDFQKWETKLMKASEIPEMSECLLRVSECVLDKFLQGFMKPANKSSEAHEEVKAEEDEDDNKKDGNNDKPEKEDKREKAIREWKEAVESCQTMSRLHVLMVMLDTCIKWEKSAENAKCKICRKKCNDAMLLLCDECNQAFHMYCLRPPLAKLPSGDWFCPACKSRRPQERSAEFENETEEEEEKDVACRECGGSDKLIVCSKCPAAYHIQCHDPPLRHPPRGVWECSDCKNGITDRRSRKYSRKATRGCIYKQETTASEDEDEESEYEEEEEVYESSSRTSSRSRKPRESIRARGRKPQTTATPSSTGQPARSSRSGNSATNKNSDMIFTSPTRTSKRGPSELSLCEDVLQKVMKHKSSWPFLEPVDKKQVPDYYTLIKKPMDFQTMLKKCMRLSYASPQEFIEDAALVFENAEAYNKSDSDVYTCMREIEKVFKEALHKVLPDWPYYRTVVDREENSSGSETGRRRSRNR